MAVTRTRARREQCSNQLIALNDTTISPGDQEAVERSTPATAAQAR